MPRSRVKTTSRGSTSESTMKKAAELCMADLMSERAAAAQFNICHVSLNRYIKKLIIHRDTGCMPPFGYRPHNKIFDEAREKQLAGYARISADMYFGFNLKKIRKMAYEFAVKLGLTVPKSWHYNKLAGPDWASDFLKRNPSLATCLPKAICMSRAVHFNPANIKHFFDKYEAILHKYNLQADDIYNMDELGVTFVQRTGRIAATRTSKHLANASADDCSVSMCLAINAPGHLVPPMYIFSKAANNLSITQGVEFLKHLKQFAKYVKPSVDKKVLILLENHESHLCVPVIDFCREAGILLLSFPPHCSQRLQPLSRAVYRPFNQCLNKNMIAWTANNPGKKLTAYDVPLVSTNALVTAATTQNIIDGFCMAGIWPLNREAFPRDQFTPGFVTGVGDTSVANVVEEPINYAIKNPKNCITEEPVNNIDITPHDKPEESVTRPIVDVSTSGIFPEHAKRYLKQALEDKKMKKIEKKRKKKRTILTDAPEKLETEDKTKKNAKRSQVFKSKKAKKPKI